MNSTATTAKSSRSTDRLLEALATLAALLDRTINEVKVVEQDFQNRLLHAVHDTETSLQTQAAHHLEKAIAETSGTVHRELTESFTAKLEALRVEFHEERDRLQGQLSAAKEDVAGLAAERGQLRDELNRIRAEAEKEFKRADEAQRAVVETQDRVRQEVTEQFAARLDSVKSEFEEERDRLSRELTRSAEAAAQLDADRSRLTLELERARLEVQEAIARADQATSQMVARSSSNGNGSSPIVTEEITNAETRLREILALIEDPATELSTVIRKNVERSEIEAYIRGILFALDHGK